MQWLAAGVLLAGCSVASGAYDLHDQTLSCEQTNRLVYHTLEAMGFAVTRFDLAAIGRPGTLQAWRQHDGDEQHVTVNVRCTGATADIEAVENGCFRSGTEFKRAFHRAFVATGRRAGSEDNGAAGLDVRMRPVPGLGAKLDFGVDMAARGLLPVQVVIDNQTDRAYAFNPAECVLVDANGLRAQPLSLDDVVYRIAWADPASSVGDVTDRLQVQTLLGSAVEAHQRVQGFLFYPLGTYVEGRMRLEERGTDESEGVVVRFR